MRWLDLADDRLHTVFDIDASVKLREKEGIVEAIGRQLPDFNSVDCGLYAGGSLLFDELQNAVEQIPCAELVHGVERLVRSDSMVITRCEEGAWFDVDTPADLVHAEMRVRKKRRESSVSRFSLSQVVARVNSSYQMSFGDNKETKILVGRGLVRNPLSIPVVPPSASSSPVFVFCDETVNSLYGRDFVSTLSRAGYNVRSIVLPDGEDSKSMANYLYLVERVLSKGVDERSVLVSLGGGVVCNVCGFVASTMYRGLDLVHLPTSLMAQCDAAISHKQGINGTRGKNLVGSYFPPKLIAVDIDVLSTLSNQLVSDGLSEVIKHALGQDASYADLLMNYAGKIDDADFLERVVNRNIQLKCDLVRDDPKEEHGGMVLQYGHTVGHPIEHLSGYGLSHGQSVAIGMAVAARISHLMGACSRGVVQMHRDLLERFTLPHKVPSNIRASDIIDALQYNKKYLSEGTTMALLSDVGRLWKVDGKYAIPVCDEVIEQAVELCREDESYCEAFGVSEMDGPQNII